MQHTVLMQMRSGVYYDYGKDEYDYWSDEGDSVSGDHAYWTAGTYNLVAVGYVYDEDAGEDGELVAVAESDPIKMTVAAPNGTIDVTMPELPDVITAGNNLSFSSQT